MEPARACLESEKLSVITSAATMKSTVGDFSKLVVVASLNWAVGQDIPSFANGKNAIPQKAMYQYGQLGFIRDIKSGAIAEMMDMIIR